MALTQQTRKLPPLRLLPPEEVDRRVREYRRLRLEDEKRTRQLGYVIVGAVAVPMLILTAWGVYKKCTS